MITKKIILGLLIVGTSLISCESQKEEDVKVSLTYSHEQSRQKSIRSPIVFQNTQLMSQIMIIKTYMILLN